ncbi:nucleoside hydrolase [Arthrobacter pigmenti]
MPPRIILDCDPGHDDAIAMLLAHGNPDIELLAVTTVAGNQTLEKVTRNALAIAHIAGITDVPVAAGSARPFIRTLRTAADIHGESGLDGPSLPDSALELDERHAVDLIIDTVMKHDAGTVTLVPTGPLTNIALAVRKEPRIADRVREVVLMGGGYHAGNQTAAAEFNVFVDPEAAHIVFNETWPLTMVGLDLTHQALATDDVTNRITALGTGPARFVNELLGFYAGAHQHAQEANFPPVHDPCAVARVIAPSVMTTRRAPLDVELSGSLTLGMTVADFRIPPPVDCTTSVAVDLDTERFWDLVIDAIGRIGEGGL